MVPKQHFASAAEATEENAAVIGHIYAVIAKIAYVQVGPAAPRQDGFIA